MRIIRHGHLSPSKEFYRGECPDCGSVFECSEEELSVASTTHGVRERPCPTMGCSVRVAMKKVVVKAGEPV